MQDSHTEENEPEEDVKAPIAAEELLENTEAFSFPDDCNRPPAKPSSDDEEDFCILGEDPGTGIIVRLPNFRAESKLISIYFDFSPCMENQR